MKTKEINLQGLNKHTTFYYSSNESSCSKAPSLQLAYEVFVSRGSGSARRAGPTLFGASGWIFHIPGWYSSYVLNGNQYIRIREYERTRVCKEEKCRGWMVGPGWASRVFVTFFLLRSPVGAWGDSLTRVPGGAPFTVSSHPVIWLTDLNCAVCWARHGDTGVSRLWPHGARD